MLQMGGAFLVNNQGDIIFSHIDKYMGDHATSDELHEAVESHYQMEQ